MSADERLDTGVQALMPAQIGQFGEHLTAVWKRASRNAIVDNRGRGD